MTQKGLNDNVKGISFLLLAMLIISLQNIAVKWIGGDYPVLEIVSFRSVIALPCTLLFFKLEGRSGLPTTKQLKLELLRGLFLFISYTTHFMGLAAIPLAEIEAIRFSIPLMITILSVLFLAEKVNLRRWLTLLVGFIGILIVIKPGSATFNIGSIFILISVLFYALTVILTRSLHKTDSSATMAYYSSLTYLAAALVFSPLMLIFNETPNIHPSFAFLVRPWQMPSLIDGVIMAGLGLVWAAWTFFMAKAYSVAQASVVAPFEYSSLPINILWGIIIWQEMPTLSALFGALLTISSGIYIFYYDRKHPSKAQ